MRIVSALDRNWFLEKICLFEASICGGTRITLLSTSIALLIVATLVCRFYLIGRRLVSLFLSTPDKMPEAPRGLGLATVCDAGSGLLCFNEILIFEYLLDSALLPMESLLYFLETSSSSIYVMGAISSSNCYYSSKLVLLIRRNWLLLVLRARVNDWVAGIIGFLVRV